jgi:hypothetical protein
LVVGLAALVACKTDKDKLVQQAVSDHSTILCDHLFACCTSAELADLPFVDDKTPPTHDGCVAFHTQNGQQYVGDTNAEEGAGRIAIHVEASGACADQTRALDCKDFHDRLVKVHVADAFALCNSAIVEPLVADGGQCRLYLDCTSGYCEMPKGTAPDAGPDVLGTCKPMPKENEPCPGLQCADGLRCSSSQNKCVKLIAAGGNCLEDDECVNGACRGGKCVSPGQCGG